MTQDDKIKSILKGLYIQKHDGKYYLIIDIFKEMTGEKMDVQEALNLAHFMKKRGWIRFIGSHEGPLAEIDSEGINYIEPEIEEERNNKVILDTARRNYNLIDSGHFDRNPFKYKDELESELYQFDLEEDKLTYLKEVKKLLNKGLTKILHNPEIPRESDAERDYNTALNVVSSKIKYLSREFSNFINYTPVDPVTKDEEHEINARTC